MTEPTKSPWHYSELTDEDLDGNITVDCYIVMGNNGTDLVAEVFTQSDACFIAAAPELLESQENLLAAALGWADSVEYDRDPGWDYNEEPVIVAARAAIAKAKGEPCPTE